MNDWNETALDGSLEEEQFSEGIKRQKMNESTSDTEITSNESSKAVTRPAYFTECCPVKTLDDLYTLISYPPPWVERILPRAERSLSVVGNVLSDCHTKSEDFAPKLRIDARYAPKTLVCHDYKNGYLEDRHLEGVKVGDRYSFYNWAHVDYFVYFSHHFITIPPLCWINAAHKNGVKILGTLITESQDGMKLCEVLFRDEIAMKIFAKQLVQVTKTFHIDGWLLNIENTVDNSVILKSFVGYFTRLVHELNPENVVLWYDSVLDDGKLEWQNELNEKNVAYFDLCDGIYLNYVWTEDALKRSIKMAKHRSLNIFVGVDVFGRNTFGGGEFNCYKAAELIRRYNLSMAIFAPGWTHETLEPPENSNLSLMEEFLNRDCAFWNSLWPYLYTHPIIRYFETDFSKGIDSHQYNLFDQDFQLSKILHPKYLTTIPNYTEIPTLNRKCDCLQCEFIDNQNLCLITKKNLFEGKYVHNLFACDIRPRGQLVVYYVAKHTGDTILGLQLLACSRNGRYKKIVLNGAARPGLVSNCSIMEINPLLEGDILVALKNKFYSLLEKGMHVRAYNFTLNRSYIMEIGAVLEQGNSASIAAFGISTI